MNTRPTEPNRITVPASLRHPPALARTPGLLLGPFYPLHPPADAGARLWTAVAAGAKSAGRPVEVAGRVLNQRGAPVDKALVEVWQADPCGRYRHPSAPLPAPDDPGFTGYGAVRTDAGGAFCFVTLAPGAYAEGDGRRAPHIHFQVTGRIDRLVTQMFFPNDPMTEGDRWFRATRFPQRLLASVVDDSPDVLRLGWDIVLATG